MAVGKEEILIVCVSVRLYSGYLLCAHVLGLQSITSHQLLLSNTGVLGAYYPSEVLGLDDALLNSVEDRIRVAYVAIPLFACPCLSAF